MKIGSYFQPAAKEDQEIVNHLERLSRQTSLAALETVLDIGSETAGLTRNCTKSGMMAKAVATHIIRAGMEMQQTMNLRS